MLNSRKMWYNINRDRSDIMSAKVMDKVTSRIIDNLNTLIMEIGIKKKHIATRAGMDKSQLGRILNKDRVGVTLGELSHIAEAVGSTIDKVLSEDFVITPPHVDTEIQLSFSVSNITDEVMKDSQDLEEIVEILNSFKVMVDGDYLV